MGSFWQDFSVESVLLFGGLILRLFVIEERACVVEKHLAQVELRVDNKCGYYCMHFIHTEHFSRYAWMTLVATTLIRT